MNIEFELIENMTPEYVNCLVKWNNDSAIKHKTRLFKSEDEINKPFQAEDVNANADYLKNVFRKRYLIRLGSEIVGDVNFMMDPPMLHKKTPHSAWLGIVVGEASARGKGVGKAAMHFIEQEAIKQGAVRMELGVFEHNESAFEMYKKLGYKEIARIPGRTYWNGKMWHDVRMEKWFKG